MKRTFLSVALHGIIFFPALSQHTFSIVAVDTATGEVGGAGASCISGNISVNIINGLIPGRAAMNAQAWVCVPNVNLQNGLNWLQQGLSPQQTLDSLIAKDACFAKNYDPTFRQYGIADMDSSGSPRVVGYTGVNADDWKGHITGPNYAIQGNILLGSYVLDSIESGFLNTTGGLAKRLMAALQGANFAGADSRCLADSTSSRSSFIRVARPCDSTGQFWLDLSVPVLPNGKEPIDSLQILFDNFESQKDTCLLLSSAFAQSADTVDITGGGKTVFFTNFSQNAETWKWYVDSLWVGSTEHFSFFFNTPGVHTVTLLAIRGAGCCKENGCCSAGASSTVVVTGTSGLEKRAPSAPEVFPVPVRERLNFAFSGEGTELSHYEIQDALGRKVRGGKLREKERSIDVSDLEAGYYFLTLSSGDFSFHTRFMVISPVSLTR